MSRAADARAEPRTAGAVPLYGVDTMVFVHHFEGRGPQADRASALLAAAETGRCRLVTSVLAVMEVLVVPKREGLDDLCQAYRRFFDGLPNFTVVPVDLETAMIAAEIRATHRVKPRDAVHLATAVQHRVDALVSEDRALRRVNRVRVIGLDELGL